MSVRPGFEKGCDNSVAIIQPQENIHVCKEHVKLIMLFPANRSNNIKYIYS